jgi:sorting nexin-1/2
VDLNSTKLTKFVFRPFSSCHQTDRHLAHAKYFDTRRQTLDSFETQLRLLLVSLANSAKLRHTLQTSLGELQAAFIALASCDLSGPLRSALEKAAGLQGKLRESSEAQSTSEEEIGGLTSTAEGYARLCGSVKVRLCFTPWC